MVYFFGIIGLSIPETCTFFKQFTPTNIFLTTLCIFILQKNLSKKFYIYSFLVFISGYFIEVIGSQTGLLFGNYSYGETLGFKIFNTPVVIGCSWLLLSVTNANTVEWIFEYLLKKNIRPNGISAKNIKIFKSMLAASLMVLLDLLIEPVAIKFNFWNWKNNHIPNSNYFFWFVFSFLFQMTFFSFNHEKSSKSMIFLLALQWIFFIFLNLF